MDKRGQGTEELIIFHIAIPLMALMIGIGMFMYASSNADMTAFWKNFYAKDLALTMDSVYGVKGDIDLLYMVRSPDHHFIYRITEGEVKVMQNERDIPSIYHFATTPYVELGEQADVSRSFPITREGGTVKFERQEYSICDILETSDDDYKEKRYYIGSTGTNDEADALRQRLEVLGYAISQNSLSADLRIFIDSGDDVVYYQALANPESQKLACIISENTGFQMKGVIPYGETEILKYKPSVIIAGDPGPEEIEKSISEYYG